MNNNGINYTLVKSPIASIGAVNLTNGKNKMFSSVWQCWDKNSCAVIIMHDQESDVVRAVVTATNSKTSDYAFEVKELENKYMPDPRRYDLAKYKFVNDQSGRPYKGTYRVIGVFEHNPEGHMQISKMLKCKSLWFATFK